jgi:hypothetical protein
VGWVDWRPASVSELLAKCIIGLVSRHCISTVQRHLEAAIAALVRRLRCALHHLLWDSLSTALLSASLQRDLLANCVWLLAAAASCAELPVKGTLRKVSTH